MRAFAKSLFDIIITLLNCITVLCIFYLIALRFFPHDSYSVFQNPSYTKGYFFLFLLFINIFLLYVTLIVYFEKKIDSNGFFNVLGDNINNWIDNSYKRLVDFIGQNNGPVIIGRIIVFVMECYISIPLKILKYVEYIPRLLFTIHLFLEIIFFNALTYCFYTIYLLLFTYLHHALLFFSLHWYKESEKIADESLIYSNWHNYIDKDGNSCVGWNVRLSDKNKYYDSVEEAQFIGSYARKCLFLLKKIVRSSFPPFWYRFLIRFLYIFSFSYILYFYPLPIITSIVYKFQNIYILSYKFLPISFIILLAIIVFNVTDQPKESINTRNSVNGTLNSL